MNQLLDKLTGQQERGCIPQCLSLTDKLFAGSLLDPMTAFNRSRKVDIVDQWIGDKALRISMGHVDAL